MAVSSWPTVKPDSTHAYTNISDALLGGGTCADAMLGRVVHNATVVETGEIDMRELTACGSRAQAWPDMKMPVATNETAFAATGATGAADSR